MRSRKMLVAAIGLSMVSAPALAQSAAPLSLAAPVQVGAMDGASSLAGDSYLLPAIVIAAVLAAAILLSNDNEEPDNPASP